MGEVQEDATIEALRKFVTKWGAVIALASGSAKLFYDLGAAQKKTDEGLSDLIRRYDADHSISVDGFVDPRTRLALDAHVKGILRDLGLATRNEIKVYFKILSRLNPDLKLPPE